MLANKGYKPGFIIKIDTENSWGADTLVFEEFGNGKSVCALYHSEGRGSLQRVATYRKLKVAEKYEIIGIVAQLPKYENKN